MTSKNSHFLNGLILVKRNEKKKHVCVGSRARSEVRVGANLDTEIKGRPLLPRRRRFGPTKKITLPPPPNAFSTIYIPRVYF